MERVPTLHALSDEHWNECHLLLAPYADPWRAYHNTDHIAMMLDGLYELAGHDRCVSELYDELALAILFHDVVYELAAPIGYNEYSSSCIAEEFVYRAFPDVSSIHLAHLIMATTHHAPQWNAINGSALIADLDLLTFSCATEEYVRHSAHVVAEFCSKYPFKDVISGRTEFLKTFRNKTPFYYTEHPMFDTARAITNIDFELSYLSLLLPND